MFVINILQFYFYLIDSNFDTSIYCFCLIVIDKFNQFTPQRDPPPPQPVNEVLSPEEERQQKSDKK